MKTKFLFFCASLLLYCFSHGQDEFCKNVYPGKGQEARIPKELRNQDPALAKAINEGPYAQQFATLASLLRAFRSDSTVDQVAYAFRNHLYEATPFTSKKQQQEFISEIIRVTGVKKITESEAVQVRNIFDAIQKNLDPGSLSKAERLMLSYLLKDTISKPAFLKKNMDQFQFDHPDAFKAAFLQGIDIIVKNPRYRKTIDRLLKNDNFVAAMVMMPQYYPEYLMVPNVIEMIVMSGRKSAPLKDNLKSREYIANALLTFSELVLLRVAKDHTPKGDPRPTVFDIWNKSFGHNQPFSREEFIVKAEDLLLKLHIEPRLVKDVVDLIDLATFEVPAPLDPNNLGPRTANQGRRLFTNIKVEAESNMPKQTSNGPMTPKVELIDWNSAKVADLFTPPPQRGKNKRKKGGQKRADKKSFQEQKAQVDNTPKLSEIEFPEAGINYSFSMKRQDFMEPQKIIFQNEALTPFRDSPDVQIAPFLLALEYGFTARSGSNGIKKMGAFSSKGDIDFYEVKPGVSRFRIILTREGSQWAAIKTLHKDEVDRFLQSQ